MLFLPLLATLPQGAAAQTAEEPARLETLQLQAPAADRAEVRIGSSGELGLVGVRADPGGGFSLQFPMHVPGPAVEDFDPASGLISAVRTTVERTSRGPLTRVSIRTRRPAAHAMSTEGRWLRLRLWAKEAEPEEVALRRLAAELRASLAASERAREELNGRIETLTAENRELARSFDTMETRRRDLDQTLKTTLGEVTEILSSLSAETEELNAELRRAADREKTLQAQVVRLETALADSEASLEARQAEIARLAEQQDELRQRSLAREARERELEADLEAQRAEIARLEQESSALSARLSERLAEAATREDELREQLEDLGTTLADAQKVARQPTVEIETGPGDDQPSRGLPVTEVGLEASRSADWSTVRARRGVHLRTGPGTENESLQVLPAGTEAEILTRGSTWAQVRLLSGQEGWIHGDWLETADTEETGEEQAPTTVRTTHEDGSTSGSVDPEAGGDLFYIVVATETERQRAADLAEFLRTKGYPGEVHWSESGFFVVTLDRLPTSEARARRDEAVRAGDVAADSYLAAGTTFRNP